MIQSSTFPSFEALFDEHMTRLWRLSLRLCATHEDAEDLLQEAALVGFRAFSRFEANTNFVAWMGTIVVNAHRNRLRANARHVQTVSLDALSEDGEAGDYLLYERLQAQGKNARRGDPVARLFDALDGALVAQAFSSLPPEFRECCALFWVSELSYEQIAQTLDVPLGTVRSRLHRGRQLLQRALWSLANERGIVGDKSQDSGSPRTKGSLLGIIFLIGAFFAARMPQ